MVDTGVGVPGGPPGTEMFSISFRDQLWLNTFPLDRSLVFDYFAQSPFYDRSCSNEQLRMRSIHPFDTANLKQMTGMEYILFEAQEPHLFVIKKQKRDGPEKQSVLAAYYILDGSIYQAPQLHSVIGSRVVRTLYHISKAYSEVAAKLEKTGHDAETASIKASDENAVDETVKKAADKAVDMKEIMRIDQILSGLLRKLPPAPPPPPFPVITLPGDGPQAQGTQLAADVTHPAPTNDQALPAKRIKTEKQ